MLGSRKASAEHRLADVSTSLGSGPEHASTNRPQQRSTLRMAASSRGFAAFKQQSSFRLPSSLRAGLFGPREQFFQPNAVHQSRNFSSSILRRYQYPKSPLNKPSTFVSSDPVLRQVVQTRQPVVLYEAPKSKWYYWKVYGLAAIWIGTGAYSIKFQEDVKDIPDLAFFVRPTYVVVGLSFIAIGCYICSAPTNRVRSLEVVPSMMGGPMQLRMAVKQAPWSKERIIYSNLGGATISEKCQPMAVELQEAERARRQSVWQDMDNMNILSKAWEGSARWVHQKWTSFFLKFKYAVLRFGIAKVEVQGEKWKIDCSGYLLENGKAVDRIIPEE
ncbi:uncharacterized protein M421DRAFT_414969 [Didymella exigua CBS 183.55]|uniref:Uncharacterized protein n=1 Tax=Didymella exigua CBS 183.55 TaxID=1150837 RepID=A0A6A5S8W5_9PLEO|nr:uncharacterized protein M421DRAFT_414969 [Didymella exigua CBS 183.55]KAF1933917.1 hypothetical protein M421DRAFT_414969 [Didymella exigua CBS 183.55]